MSIAKHGIALPRELGGSKDTNIRVVMKNSIVEMPENIL